MSIRLSTALVNYLAQGGSLKRALWDACIDIYNNSQPASADNPSGSTILNRITYQGNTFVPNTPSTAKKDKLVVGGSGPFTSLLYTYVVNGTPYTYTGVLADTVITIAHALALLIDTDPSVSAIDDGAGEIIVKERFPGVGFTSATTGTTGTMALTSVTASSRSNGIQWGSVSSVGDLPKESGIWQGTALASGLAGWGRIKAQGGQNIYGLSQTFDTDTQTTAFLRLDFAINTANSDMIALSSLNMVLGVTATIDSADLIFPQS